MERFFPWTAEKRRQRDFRFRTWCCHTQRFTMKCFILVGSRTSSKTKRLGNSFWTNHPAQNIWELKFIHCQHTFEWRIILFQRWDILPRSLQGHLFPSKMLTAEQLKAEVGSGISYHGIPTAAEQETEFSYLPVAFKLTYLSIYLSGSIFEHILPLYVQPP